MKNFKHFLVACFLWSLVGFSFAHPILWVKNIFNFITWYSVISLFVMQVLAPKEDLIKSYKEKKHAPLWFDVVTYLPIIFSCAAFGAFWQATVWLLVASEDYNRRALAEKSK